MLTGSMKINVLLYCTVCSTCCSTFQYFFFEGNAVATFERNERNVVPQVLDLRGTGCIAVISQVLQHVQHVGFQLLTNQL